MGKLKYSTRGDMNQEYRRRCLHTNEIVALRNQAAALRNQAAALDNRAAALDNRAAAQFPAGMV